jgi:hypothetical protein
MDEPGIKVSTDARNNLVVMASEEMRREMRGRLAEADDLNSDVSLWDVELDYIPLVVERIIDDLGINVIRVKPEQIGALTDEAAMLLVDTGLTADAERPDDFFVWNEGWKINEINQKYIKRVWWDRMYQIRSWVETLQRYGEFTFYCDYDSAEDDANEEASENAVS